MCVLAVGVLYTPTEVMCSCGSGGSWSTELMRVEYVHTYIHSYVRYKHLQTCLCASTIHSQPFPTTHALTYLNTQHPLTHPPTYPPPQHPHPPQQPSQHPQHHLQCPQWLASSTQSRAHHSTAPPVSTALYNNCNNHHSTT